MAEEKKGRHSHIDLRMGVLLIAVALFFDASQAVVTFLGAAVGFATGGVGLAGSELLINSVFTGLATAVFTVWFYFLGVNFFKASNVVKASITLVLEWLPILRALPMWTLFIIVMIMTIYDEDTGYFGGVIGLITRKGKPKDTKTVLDKVGESPLAKRRVERLNEQEKETPRERPRY